jgi:cbb3-type cytochrome oxidase maturation protein
VNLLIVLIPIALFLGALGLAAFIWSLKSGQYDDLEGAKWRVLEDDEDDRPAGSQPAQRNNVR